MKKYSGDNKHDAVRGANLKYFLRAYLRERPLFLSMIRAKEALLYQQCLPFGDPVLDVGCGDGFFADIAWKNTSREMVGLDLVDSRMDQARKRAIYQGLVSFDGTHIPFPDTYFGTVVSNCVLEHVSDLTGLLSDIARVTKSGGMFVTTVMAKPWENHLAGSLIMGNSYKSWMRNKQVHLNLFTQKEWEWAFERAGFTIRERIGYLSPAACRWIDIAHYLSVPSLATYALWGKWILHPAVARIYPVQMLQRILAPNVSPEKSGALFFVLQK